MNTSIRLPIMVYKIDPDGHERHYPSFLIAHTTTSATLEGPFTGTADHDAGYVVFQIGDRCVEYYFADHPYNILELHDRNDDRLRGWYCNIARPAVISPTEIRFEDLALDLWVAPDGSTLLLDEDEFHAFNLDAETQRQAWEAVDQLRVLVASRTPPFDQIAPLSPR